MRSLVFDKLMCKKLGDYVAFGKHGFIRVINQVLLLYKGDSVPKFYLFLPDMFLDSFQEVDQWMLYLSTKGVKDLTLANSNQRYRLSFCVFSCLELEKLELTKCIFKPPPQFEGFLHLKSLVLINIDFTTNFGGTVINLPQLTELSMSSCINVDNLKIKASKLLILQLKDCLDVLLLELLHSQRLCLLSILVLKPIKDFSRLKRMNLALMFSSMPEVRYFYIDGHFLKGCFAEKPRWFPHMVNSLKHIWLYSLSLGDSDQLNGALCLLRNSPNLETLWMIDIQTDCNSMENDVGTTTNYLESLDCLDQTLNRLRTVELGPLKGSRVQLLFIKLLLAQTWNVDA